MALRVKVSKKHQIAVPAEVRRELNIQSGDYLTVEVCEDGSMRLRRDPEDFLKRLSEFNRTAFAGIDVDEFIERERESWNP